MSTDRPRQYELVGVLVSFDILAYTMDMKMFLFKGLIFSVLILFGSSIQADDVLPPPADHVRDTKISKEVVGPDTKETNLYEDLAVEEGIDVHSYSHDNGDKITEYSINGRVYMIRVQPLAGFPAYYLYDNDGNGTFERRLPGGYKGISPPMWVIKKF